MIIELWLEFQEGTLFAPPRERASFHLVKLICLRIAFYIIFYIIIYVPP